MKLCLTCNQSPQHTIQNSGREAKWLSRLNRKSAIPPKFQHLSPRFENNYPKSADMQIKTTLQHKKTVICWWAAMPSKNYKELSGPEIAYALDDQYPNSGTAVVHPDGSVIIKLLSPQIYMEEEKAYPRHLHYVVPQPSGKRWDLKRVYTLAAFPSHSDLISTSPIQYTHMFFDAERFAKKEIIAINALPYEYDSIFDSDLHIPYTEEILQGTVSYIGNKPYVVYCEHSGCIAATTLIAKLVQKGCPNVFYYPGGRRDFKKFQLIKKLLRLR